MKPGDGGGRRVNDWLRTLAGAALLAAAGVARAAPEAAVPPADAVWVNAAHRGPATGSRDRPFPDLAAACARARAGATLAIAEGEYSLGAGLVLGQSLTLLGVGPVVLKGAAAGAPAVTVRAGTATLRCLTLDAAKPDGTPGYAAILVESNAGCVVEGCVLRNASPYGVLDRGGSGPLVIAKSAFDRVKNPVAAARGCRVTGCAFSNTVAGVLVAVADGAPGAVTVSGNVSEARGLLVRSGGMGDVRIGGNRTRGPLASIARCEGVIEVSDNEVESAARATLINVEPSCRSGRVLIRGNRLLNAPPEPNADSREGIRVVSQADVRIEGNRIEDRQTGPWAGIQVISKHSDAVTRSCVIRNNELRLHARSGYGICVGAEGTTANDDKIQGAIVEHNTVYGAQYFEPALGALATHSIFVGHNRNAHVRYNTVIGGGTAIAVKHTGGVFTEGGLYYNVVRNSNLCLANRAAHGVSVFNNLVVTDNPNLEYVMAVYFKSLHTKTSDVPACRDCVVKNNLVLFDAPYQGRRWSYLWGDTVYATNLVCDYNGVFSRGAAIVMGGAGQTWAQWQAAGRDRHGLNADPRLGGDFAPRADSPMRAAGANLGPAYRFGLSPRTQPLADAILAGQPEAGPWCLGAYIESTAVEASR